MNIVEFINEMGDNGLLCNPRARYTEKQQKFSGGIFRALKLFRESHSRDATEEEFHQIAREEAFHQIAREVKKSYSRTALEKRKTVIKKSLVAAL